MKKQLLAFLIIFPIVAAVAQIKPEKNLATKGQFIYCLAFSNDGNYVASAGDNKEVIIHKTGTYEELVRLKGLKDIPLALCFSHNGKLIAAGGKDNKITIWDFATKQIIATIKAHDQQVMDLSFSPDDKTIASASLDKEIKIWDTNNGQLIALLTGNKKDVTSIEYSPDGSRLISGSADGTIKIWDVKSTTILLNIPAHASWIRSVAYSPDGSMIASGGDDRQIQIWDAISGEKLNTFLGHKKWVQAVCFSPDGNYLLSGGHDNLLILTDIKTGKMVFQSEKQPYFILSIGFNPNGTTFGSAALYSDILEIWDIRCLNIKPMEKLMAQKASSTSGMVPSIQFISPKSGLSSNSASIKVSAKITSESSLRTIELLVNGAVFASKDRSELMMNSGDKGEFNYEESIVLNEGKNTIQVKAKNIAGESQSELVTVNFSSAPVVLLSWLVPAMAKVETNTQDYTVKATINRKSSSQVVELLVNNSVVATSNFPPEGGAFSKQITLQSGQNNLSFRITTKEFSKETESRLVNYSVANKPEIVLLQPTSDTLSYISGVRIKALLLSQIPIDGLELKVNGLTIFSKSNLTETQFVLDQQVQVSPGLSTITISARNAAGEAISSAIKVAYQLPDKTDISWVTPSANIEIFETGIALRACIQSKSDIQKVELFNNGSLLFTENQPVKNSKGECSFDFIKSISVAPGTNQIRISATNAGGTTYSETRSVTYVIPQLATIQWKEPASMQISTGENSLSIQACIQSSTQPESIDLMVNGLTISTTPNPPKNQGDCSYIYQQMVPLNKGSNLILLKIKNKAGETFSSPIMAENKSSNPYRFAIIIGNEDYSSYQTGLDSESNVDFAKKDAQSFKEVCINSLGIQEENIVYMEDARYTDMMKSLKKINSLINVTKGKAEIFAFYAGHGFPDEKTKEPYLVPVDGSGTDLEITGVKLTYFYEMLTTFPSQRVTVFLDACFSGGARNQGLVAARGVKIVPKETQEAVKKKLIVFTASSGNQTSLPYTEKEHGLFTYFLIKKLNETKGNVTYEELSNYLTEQVSIKSVMINSKQQDPQTNVSPEVEAEWKKWKFAE